MPNAAMQPADRHRELALLGLLALLWGSSYLFIKVAVASIPPVTLIAIRVSIAAAFLLVVMRLQGAHLPRERGMWRLLFIQSLCNSIASWTILAWGQQHVDSGLAGVLNSTSPIFVILITLHVTRHEPVSGAKVGGALLGLAGVVLIVGPHALQGLGVHVAGQVAVVLGAVLYAFAAIHGKRFAALSPTVTAAGTMLWAVACLVPLSLVVDRPWTLTPSPRALAAAGALGLFCTGVALLIYFRLARTIGSVGVASNSYLRAGVSVLLGIVFLGEHITAMIGVGLAAIILGVAAINVPPGAPALRPRRP